VGTALWILAAVVVALVRPPGIWQLTCVVGAVLGGVGYSIFAWQRSAARRGSRTAQQGLR
jgi:Flp pilus assembly protein TadB